MMKKGLKGQKEAKTVKNRQGTKETRTRVKNQPKIKAGSKYSFNAGEEYISIKESKYLDHSKDNLDAYRELLRIIDEGWIVETLDEE
ncbi:hypothetical protein Tco_1453674 [Tanacetum coccineum]